MKHLTFLHLSADTQTPPGSHCHLRMTRVETFHISTPSPATPHMLTISQRMHTTYHLWTLLPPVARIPTFETGSKWELWSRLWRSTGTFWNLHALSGKLLWHSKGHSWLSSKITFGLGLFQLALLSQLLFRLFLGQNPILRSSSELLARSSPFYSSTTAQLASDRSASLITFCLCKIRAVPSSSSFAVWSRSGCWICSTDKKVYIHRLETRKKLSSFVW